MDDKIQVRVVVAYAAAELGGRIASVVGFVAGATDAARLRTQARLVGVAVGAVGRADSTVPVGDGGGEDDDGSGVVQLSMAEIVVGVTEGHLRLVTEEGGVDALQLTDAMARIAAGSSDEPPVVMFDDFALLRVSVFVDLWRRGHFVACGSKFGVDFLVYESDPSSCHSFAMVVVKDYTAMFATVDVVTHCRVAKMVKKIFLLASQQKAQIVYLSLDHAVLAAAQPERR